MLYINSALGCFHFLIINIIAMNFTELVFAFNLVTILETFYGSVSELRQNMSKATHSHKPSVGFVSGPAQSFHVGNTTELQCRPPQSFQGMNLISAYAGLLIMFIIAIYSRYGSDYMYVHVLQFLVIFL